LCRQIPDRPFQVVGCGFDGAPHCVALKSLESNQRSAMAEPPTMWRRARREGLNMRSKTMRRLGARTSGNAEVGSTKLVPFQTGISTSWNSLAFATESTPFYRSTQRSLVLCKTVLCRERARPAKARRETATTQEPLPDAPRAGEGRRRRPARRGAKNRPTRSAPGNGPLSWDGRRR